LGTNLTGDERADLINQKCDSSYGELHFIDNQNNSHILIRGKHKFNNKKNFISLDGKIVTQTDLMSFFKDKKLLLSILNPFYFLSKRPNEQKELVEKCLSDIRPKVIFDKLSKQNQNMLLQKYYNGTKPFEELTDKEQTEFINCTMFNIFMDIAYNNLSKNEQKILKGIPQDIPTFISELNGNIKLSEKTISLLNGKIEYAQNIANENLPNYKEFEKKLELSLARQELAFLNTNQDMVNKEKQKQVINNLEKDILNKETEITELEKRMKDGKKKYLEIKNGTICNCPTCGQHIQNNSKIETIKNMKTSLISDFEKKNLLDTQKKNLSNKLMIERCKYHALEGETTIEKGKQIAVIEEKIKKLENEQLEIEKSNNEIKLKETNIKNATLDIQKFSSEILYHQKLIENAKERKRVAQKLYITYIEKKMSLAKQYLKYVDIKFYSILKTTGEVKEDFIITYNGRTLPDLSGAETIATAMEFANMFNKIAKTNFPLFIDETERCEDFDFIKKYSDNSQLIISKAKKRAALKIANYNNNNEFTIIKQPIIGFKTMKVHKCNTKSMLNAA